MIEKFIALAANSFMKIQFQNLVKKKGSEQNWCLQGAPLSAELRSPLAERQKCGVEHAAGLVGLLALVTDLGFEVVPVAELLAVFPARRECRDGTSVHEVRDALEVGLVRCGVRHVFKIFPVGHLDLHEPRPALGVGDHRAAVSVRVHVLELLPAGFVGEFDGGGVGQLGLDLLAMSTSLLLVLRLPLLPLALVLGFDASVARLVLVGEDGVRIGSDFALDVARLGTLLITEDEVGIGIAVHQHRDAVEFLLRREVSLLGEPNHLLDGVDDEAVVDVRLFGRHASFLLSRFRLPRFLRGQRYRFFTDALNITHYGL